MNEPLTRKIEDKLMNSPGFFEGLSALSQNFHFRTKYDFMASWPAAELFLIRFEFVSQKASITGWPQNTYPFRTEDNLKLARIIYLNYFE